MERDALAAVFRGASFATICETIAEAADDPSHLAVIGELLRRWLADGIVVPGDSVLATSSHKLSAGAENSG
jgi:hypothetical protein